jgi:ABC-2 type transport system permease protein
VRTEDLLSGRVPGDVDVLVVIAPQGFTDAERFAVDQYLMRGGAVVVASGSFILSSQQFSGSLMMERVAEGLDEMLASYGVRIEETMVLDPQNEPFPVQVQRQVGGMSVIEFQQVGYPYFVDVRSDGMDLQSPIVSNLPAVTMQWASPLKLAEDQNADREVSILLQSTQGSWVRSAVDVQPNTALYPEYGFPVEGEKQSWPLAVALRGRFDSYFNGRPLPFEETAGEGEGQDMALATVQSSPQSARLVVLGSSEFLDDTVLGISSRLSADRYLNNLRLLQNAVDWSVQDEDLLTIRSRGTYARLLNPLTDREQTLWEGLNYAVALIALVAIGVVWNVRRRKEQPMVLVGPHVGEQQVGGSGD